MKLRRKREPEPGPEPVKPAADPGPVGKIARAQAALAAARLELEDLHKRRNDCAQRLAALGDDDEKAQARAAERALHSELTGRIERQPAIIAAAEKTVGVLEDERADLVKALAGVRQQWGPLVPYADRLAGTCDVWLDVERRVFLPQSLREHYRALAAFVAEIRDGADRCGFLQRRIGEYGD